jgi:bisphosphoglycerate-dependent phosphoglycerate mutase
MDLILRKNSSLRSIIKELETLSEEKIVKVELGAGVPIIYGIL